MNKIKIFFSFIIDSFKFALLGIFKIAGKIIWFFLKPIFSPANARSRARTGLIFTVVLSLLAFFYVQPQIFNKAADKLNAFKSDLAKSEKLIFKSGGFDQWLQEWQFPYFYTKNFSLGLDLRGGVHLAYQADLSKIEPQNYSDAMEGARDVIERRVNIFGVSEPIVQTSESGGERRIIVDLADIKDTEAAIKMIGETPFLEFKEEKTEEEINKEKEEAKKKQEEEKTENQDNNAAINVDAKDESGNSIEIKTEPVEAPFYADPFKNTGLSGKQLEKAEVVFDPQTYRPQVSLQFNEEGKNLFAEITKRNIGKRVAIYLDGLPISIPVVNDPILDGKAVIQGNDFTIDSAKELAQRLNAGALPVPIKLIEQQNIGAVLGEASLKKSLKAGIIGLLAVMAFMFLYYRLPGLLADIALTIYVLISLAIFKFIPITMTLPGIGGFALSIGMAVDANILIFERIKEEMEDKRRTLESSIDEGFSRAWPSIRDGNISTLISCFILYTFASSAIKGFALTLSAGIIVSMFSAIIITKILIKYAILSKITGWTAKFEFLWKNGLRRL